MTQFDKREFEIWCLGLRFLLGIFLHTFLGPFLNELFGPSKEESARLFAHCKFKARVAGF